MRPSDVAAVFSFLVYLSFLIWASVYCAAASVPWLLALLMPRSLRGRIMRYIALGFGLTAIRCAMRPFFRVRYEDRSGHAGEAMIHVFNHRSGSDPFLVAAMGIEIIQLVNGWPMKLPFFGYFARLAEYVDVTRTSYQDMAGHIRSMILQGTSVVAFPEGHRSCSRTMGPLHSGIFRIAKEKGLAVCPCVIVGNEDIPDRRFRFRRRGTVLVRRLPPVSGAEVGRFASAFALKRHVGGIIAAEAEKMDKELDEGGI